MRDAGRRRPGCATTSPRSPRASTSAPNRPPSSRRSCSPPRPGARGAPGSSSTAPRRATTRPAWRSPTWASAVVVQRNVHSSVIDGLVLNGMRPTFVAPELDPELGIAHGLTPESLAAALDATPDAVAAMVVSPTYFGACADVAGARRGRPRARRAAGRRRGLGRPPALPPRPAARRARLRRRPGHLLDPQDRRQPHPGGDAPPRPRRPDRRRRWSTAASAWSKRPAPAACSPARSTRPGGRPRSTATSCSARRWRRSPRTREAIVADPRPRRARRVAWSAAPGSPAGTRCGSRSTSAAPARPATGWRKPPSTRTGSTSSSTPRTSSSRSSGSASRPRRPASGWSRRCATRSANSKPSRAPPQEKLAPPPPWGELVMTPREAFLGPQEVIPFDDAAGRIAAEGLAAYPPGIPNVLPGERLTAETLAYIRESVAHGGYVRGGCDRELKTLRVAARAAALVGSADGLLRRDRRPAARDRGVRLRGARVRDRRVRTADHGDQAARRRRRGDRRRRHLRRRRPHRPAETRAARRARRHSGTFDEFSRAARRDRPLPGRRRRERDVSRDYRRWAFESAALDLALRQAGTNLAAALGREPRPLNFVNSMRLAGFDAGETLLDRAAAANGSPSTRRCASSSTPSTTGTTS